MSGRVLLLSRFPVLAGLDDQVLQALARHAHERRFKAGEMIVLAGERSQAVYLIAHGRVRGERSSLEGREYVLHELGPGELFGLASVLDGGRALSTVMAVSDALLYAVPARDFQRIMDEYPALSLVLLSHIARRVRRLCDVAEGLALYDVRTRLARRLLTYTAQTAEHARSSADEWPCPSDLTQSDLAAQVGTVRDVVGRTLRSFSQQGLIRRERGRLVVTDLAGLRREALRDQSARRVD